MKEKERLAIFKVTVPLTFKFKGRASLDCEELHRMAQAYLDLILNFKDVKNFVNKKALSVIDKEVILTPEEKTEQERMFNEIFKGVTK